MTINQSMQGLVPDLIDEVLQLMTYVKKMNWLHFLSVLAFIFISILIAGCLLLLNESVAEFYQKRRIRSHILHISNRGNVPSVFLLRSLNLPEKFAIRFRVNNAPMIWVTRRDKKTNEEQEPESGPEQTAPVSEEQSVSPTRESGLIPDLNRPMIAEQAGSAVSHVRKTVEKVGRKAGLLASILSTVSYLAGAPTDGMKKAVSALKGVQQSVNDSIANVNTVIGQTESLKQQIGSLAGPVEKQLSDSSDTALNEMKVISALNEKQKAGIKKSDDVITDANFQELFTYDEDTWIKNIYRQDADGGALIYAQSKELCPGEAMDITLEIMNLSGNDIADTSMLYQIEIIQIPQTQSAVSSIRHHIRGIVIFRRISLWTQFAPFLIMAAAVTLGIFIILRCSYVLL